MRRLLISLLALCWFSVMLANEEEIIYQGPYAIGDWGTVEISSIKFHNLEIGDTVYVYTSKVDSTSQGSFQSHRWSDLPGVINGQAITGDYDILSSLFYGRIHCIRLEKMLFSHSEYSVFSFGKRCFLP